MVALYASMDPSIAWLTYTPLATVTKNRIDLQNDHLIMTFIEIVQYTNVIFLTLLSSLSGFLPPLGNSINLLLYSFKRCTLVCSDSCDLLVRR